MSDLDRTRDSRDCLRDREVHQRWQATYLNPYLDRFYDTAFTNIANKLRNGHEMTMLDAGCGYGFHAIRLARHGFHVVGVDLSETALAEARQRIDGAGLGERIRLQQADLLALPYPDASFDCVNCWGVLMHVPELERALAELVRVLRPGGRLALGENNQYSVQVQTWERVVPVLRRLAGAPRRQVSRTRRGKEEWRSTARGGLLVRRANIKWLIDRLDALGATLVSREAAQFTEIYTKLPWRPAKKAVHAFNYWWCRKVRLPGPALGNILVFEKRASAVAA